MPHDCHNDECDFFVSGEGAWCAACGRLQVWPRVAGAVVGAVSLIGIGVALVLAGWVFLPLAVASLIGAGLLTATAFADAVPHIIGRPSTLDARYAQACDDAAHWLGTWSEFYARSARSSDLDGAAIAAAEASLVVEAQAAAADAAHDAVERRNALGQLYVENAIERLHRLERGSDADAWNRALQTIEHYVDTLWLNPRFVAETQNMLADQRIQQSSFALATRTSSLRILEDPSEQQVTARLDEADPIGAERARLRIERELLRDSWR